MSEAVDQGITVTEIAAMDQPIDVSPETTAAFVGRTLRGPLNTPLPVGNFAEFRRRFGASWPRSSLGPAVEEFFRHGGRRLYVVRVANNARGAMICLPADGSALVLRAVEPGSTERLRAAVDYDGIEGDEEFFNLTLQRLDPESGLVVDQELFTRVSYREEAPEFVGEALASSKLAQLELPWPTHRPDETRRAVRDLESGYVDAVQAGTDGTELSDYDLIGSRTARTGLFALEAIDDLDLLYLPPPGRTIDLGPAAVLVAEQYCRDHGAMLIVDPRREWQTAEQAVSSVRELGYASPNMLGYFPRLVTRRAADEVAAGGAIAGLLCKQDRTYGPWQPLDLQGLGLHRSLEPGVAVDEEDERALAREGLNAIVAGPAGRARVHGSVTMSRGLEAHREFASLPVRRLCLRIVDSIARAARWAVFEDDTEQLRQRVRAQVTDYLMRLADLGALDGSRLVVECIGGERENGIAVLLVFRPAGCDDAISLTLHLSGSGCRVGNTAFAPGVQDCA